MKKYEKKTSINGGFLDSSSHQDTRAEDIDVP
jgi:hypothetical protein